MVGLVVIHEADQTQLKAVCERLSKEANAKCVFLIDKNGMLIASVGDVGELDTTSLAALTAGNIATTGGIAKLINEKEFSQVYHEGERDNLYINLDAERAILVVMFDARSTLGLVRLRTKKAAGEMAQIFRRMSAAAEASPQSPFAEITDEDIDSLFS